MTYKRFSCIITLLFALLSGLPLKAEVTPAKPFGEHMVLQREMPVPIWGTAQPGDKIDVTFRKQKVSTQTDASGHWMVTLAPMDASTEPEKLTINNIVWNDILVGEVWFGSGQSNIFLPVKSDYFADDKRLHDLVAEDTPLLRMIDRQGKWRTNDKQSFSAQLYAFGHMLQKELEVPVGLMVFAQGGSSTKPWLSNEMLLDDPEVKTIYDRLMQRFPKAEEAFDKLQEAKTPGWRSYKQPQSPDLLVEKASGKSKEPIGFYWDKFIQHYAGYAVRGIYWDQGESMSGIQYLDLYTTTRCLVAGWRKAWNRPELPFIMVQKPSGGGIAYDPNHLDTLGSRPFNDAFHPQRLRPGEGRWNSFISYDGAHFRLMKDDENIHLVPSADLNGGLHPWNKSGYASRGLHVALTDIYKTRPGPAYGPRYRSHSTKGSEVTVQFDNVGEGLVFKHHDKLLGFYLAGSDGRFFAAEARIDGDQVICSSDQVQEPVHVMYNLFSRRTGTKEAAKKNKWAFANLFNKNTA